MSDILDTVGSYGWFDSNSLMFSVSSYGWFDEEDGDVTSGGLFVQFDGLFGEMWQ